MAKKPRKIVNVEVAKPRTGAQASIGLKSRTSAGPMDMRPRWTRTRSGRRQHEIAVSAAGG
jgi:hypothetical protein